MRLRSLAYVLSLCCAACAGCRSTPTAPGQDVTPTFSSQLAPVTESPKFVLENTSTFFGKPTSDDLMQQR